MDAPIFKKKQLNIKNEYKFVAFKKPFDEALFTENLLEIDQHNENIIKNKTFRSYPITIEKLIEEGSEYATEQDRILASGKYIGNKWGGKYLRAPEIFFTILEKGKDKLTKLSSITEIRRGITTGCNEFFYLTSEDVEKWHVEKEFLKPAILKTNEIKNPSLMLHEAKGYFFITSKEKNELIRTKALKYIYFGETRSIIVKQGKNKGKTINGFHNIETVKKRKNWYSLGERKVPSLIWMIAHNDRTISFKNSNYLFGDNFFEIYPNLEIDSEPIFNSLNSTYITLFRELYGRANFGGGVLKTQKPDLQNFLILMNFTGDFKVLKRNAKSIFQECGIDPYSETPIEEQEPNPLPDRKELDDVVFDAIGLTLDERKEVYHAVCRLVWNRINKANSV